MPPIRVHIPRELMTGDDAVTIELCGAAPLAANTVDHELNAALDGPAYAHRSVALAELAQRLNLLPVDRLPPPPRHPYHVVDGRTVYFDRVHVRSCESSAAAERLAALLNADSADQLRNYDELVADRAELNRLRTQMIVTGDLVDRALNTAAGLPDDVTRADALVRVDTMLSSMPVDEVPEGCEDRYHARNGYVYLGRIFIRYCDTDSNAVRLAAVLNADLDGAPFTAALPDAVDRELNELLGLEDGTLRTEALEALRHQVAALSRDEVPADCRGRYHVKDYDVFADVLFLKACDGEDDARRLAALLNAEADGHLDGVAADEIVQYLQNFRLRMAAEVRHRELSIGADGRPCFRYDARGDVLFGSYPVMSYETPEAAMHVVLALNNVLRGVVTPPAVPVPATPVDTELTRTLRRLRDARRERSRLEREGQPIVGALEQQQAALAELLRLAEELA